MDMQLIMSFDVIVPDFSNFRTALSDDTSNEFIGYCHFVRLLVSLGPIVSLRPKGSQC